MIRVTFHANEFAKDMKNIIGYAEGFLQGAESGKTAMIDSLGKEAIEELKNYIDINARVSPMTLHHVYEWYQTGSPAARLFDIDYRTIAGSGLTVNSTFRQSMTVSSGSKVPFYNKARIMEEGVPVVIRPKRSEVLVFEKDGEKIFTRKPVTVVDPGGEAVQGGYERVFDAFFNQYFTQSFLRHSGIMRNLDNPTPFSANFGKAKRGGKSAGMSVGYRWMTQGDIA